MRPLLACPEQRRIDIRQSRFAAAISKAEVYLRGDCELRGILRGCHKRARVHEGAKAVVAGMGPMDLKRGVASLRCEVDIAKQ
jgi:hypothetical protein